jgi:hypothetical protein
MTRSVLRIEAVERAGGRCEFPGCDRPHDEMAHLRGSGMGGSRYRDVIENVAMLCKSCHGWLDGDVTPNLRRFNNEMVLRAALDRVWVGRR